MANIETVEKIKELLANLKNTNSENEVIITRNVFQKKYITPLYDRLKELPKEQRREFGIEVNSFRVQVLDLINKRLEDLKEKNDASTHHPIANVLIDTSNVNKGALNPVTLMSNEIIDFFKHLDFTIMNGNEVVSTEDNFDNLNFSDSHPGRDTSESFYFNKKTMLRAHNTANSVRAMHNNKDCEDLRVLTWGNVYRNDDDDLTHSHQFNQIDIVWVKEKLSVANLKWLFQTLLKHLYGNDVKMRFRLSYFIFTEPSIEVDIQCPICHGKGCNLCKHSGWIEILGAGMWNQNVLTKAGYKITTGIAAGIGIDRLAMIKYGISDIRDIYTNDFRFINQFVKENK